MEQNDNVRSLPVVWQPRERRASARLRAYSRTVGLDHKGPPVAATCENISDGGVRLRFESSVDISDAVVVVFGEDAWITGRVIWQGDGYCGIAFEQPIDSTTFLYNASGLNTVPLAANGSSVVELRPSGRGFRAGLRVKVTLASGEERRALMYWTSDETASLDFIDR